MFILIFDFDLTLTDIHSGGNPDISTLYWDSNENFTNISEILQLLKKLKYHMYIVSRGDRRKVKAYVDIYFPNIFLDVCGATEYYPTLLSELHWATIKISYIFEIMVINEIKSKDKIYFFDDTNANTKEAKLRGFNNVYTIGPEKSQATVKVLNKIINCT